MKIDLKYSWLSVLCLICLALNPIATQAQITFVGKSISLDSNERALLSQGFEKYTVFEFDQEVFYQMIDQNREYVSFTLEIGSLNETIELYENELRSPGYVAAQTGEDGYIELPFEEKCITFAGYVAGSSKDVRLNIQAHRFWGYVSTDEGQFYVEPLNRFFKDKTDNLFLLYNAVDLIESDEIKCSAEDSESIKDKAPSLGVPKEGDDCRKVEIATESAYEMYDEGVTFSDIVGNLNLVESIYLNYFGLKFLVVYQHEWTTIADPYNTTDNSGCGNYGDLDQFAVEWYNNFGNIRRDINVLYTEKNYEGGTIGCAWIGSFGNDLDNDGYFFDQNVVEGAYCVNEWDWDPWFSFTSDAERRTLVAHEMGHSFGAAHDESSGCGTIMCPTVNESTVFTSTSQSSINGGLNHQSDEPNDGRSAIRERFFPSVSGNTIFEFSPNTRSANVLQLDGALNQIGLFGSVATSYKATEKIKLLPGFNAVAAGSNKSTFKIGSCTAAEGMVENNSIETEVFVSDEIDTDVTVTIYPNPTSGQSFLEILVDRETIATIRVMDALGRQVMIDVRGLVEGKSTVTLETERLNQGLYIVNISDQFGLNQTLKLQKMD